MSPNHLSCFELGQDPVKPAGPPAWVLVVPRFPSLLAVSDKKKELGTQVPRRLWDEKGIVKSSEGRQLVSQVQLNIFYLKVKLTVDRSRYGVRVPKNTKDAFNSTASLQASLVDHEALPLAPVRDQSPHYLTEACPESEPPPGAQHGCASSVTVLSIAFRRSAKAVALSRSIASRGALSLTGLPILPVPCPSCMSGAGVL